MARPHLSAVVLLVACASPLPGEGPLAIPSWLAPFPDAVPQIHTFSNFVESRYETAAPSADVIAHYRKIFAAARLPFFPEKDPIGTSIHGETAECDLHIRISQFRGATLVNVTCSLPVYRRAEEEGMRAMERFDQPVYPAPRPQLPPLTWPTWLVRSDGAALQVRSGTDRFKCNYLEAGFTSADSRPALQAFYAGLLNQHGYPVSMESSSILPGDRTAILEGTRYAGARPGPRLVIHIEFAPAADTVHVDLRMTAHP